MDSHRVITRSNGLKHFFQVVCFSQWSRPCLAASQQRWIYTLVQYHSHTRTHTNTKNIKWMKQPESPAADVIDINSMRILVVCSQAVIRRKHGSIRLSIDAYTQNTHNYGLSTEYWVDYLIENVFIYWWTLKYIMYIAIKFKWPFVNVSIIRTRTYSYTHIMYYTSIYILTNIMQK